MVWSPQPKPRSSTATDSRGGSVFKSWSLASSPAASTILSSKARAASLKWMMGFPSFVFLWGRARSDTWSDGMFKCAGFNAHQKPRFIHMDGNGVFMLSFQCPTLYMLMIQAQTRPQFKYVGLSLDSSQVQTAQRTLDRALKFSGESASGGLPQDSFHLYCANAAKPDTWSRAIRTSVDALADGAFSQRWMLALDCLYHFSPSRKPAFKLAAETLNANVMAFDLVLDENASRWNKLLVRIVGLVMNCPLYTFLPEEQYREQLVECGYDGARIEIEEISDHVFGGVSGFLRTQEAALSQYGIGIAGFKLAGRLFE